MTPCLDEHLEAYALGRLNPDEAKAVCTHLELCDACRRELAWLRTEQRLFAERRARTSPHPIQMANLRRATLNRVPQALETSHRRERRMKAVSAGRALLSAAGAVLAAFVVAYLPQNPRPLVVASVDGADCRSEVAGPFCAPNGGNYERIAAVEDLFDACLVATPHLGDADFCQ